MNTVSEPVSLFRKKLKKKLDPARYEHSISVSFICMALAMRYGYDMEKAELAGILHDCAKHFTDEELIEKCGLHGVALTDEELAAPAVIHAKYGAYLAKNKYGVENEEILSAIACHTTGKAGMEMLDKILYIADYIEPRRDKASNLPEMRALAFEDLDETMYRILKSTLDYLDSKNAAVDPMTCEAYEFFEKIHNKKKKNGEKSVKISKKDKTKKKDSTETAEKKNRKETDKTLKKGRETEVMNG